MMGHRPVLLYIGILLLFGACRTIKPERPEEYYPDAVLRPPVSTINVPIGLDVRRLEKIFNTEYKGLIYSDTSFNDNGHDGIKLKAYKSGNITFTIDGNLLSYRVPLHIVIQKQFELGAFGFAVSDVKEASANVVLKFRTKLTLNTDWSVSSYTASDGFEWITTPVLKLGPVSLPLPVISDMLMESNLGTISKEIDRSIRSAFNLRTLADDAWKGLQKPLKISENPPPGSGSPRWKCRQCPCRVPAAWAGRCLVSVSQRNCSTVLCRTATSSQQFPG